MPQPDFADVTRFRALAALAAHHCPPTDGTLKTCACSFMEAEASGCQSWSLENIKRLHHA
eukprot:346377-Pelagomonas_calceolata.AAC.1